MFFTLNLSPAIIDSNVAVAVSLGVAILTSLTLIHRVYKNRTKNKTEVKKLIEPVKMTQLLPTEELLIKTQAIGPVLTATWVEVDEKDNYTKGTDQLKEEFKQRLRDIIALNPWLLGKIVYNNKHYHIAYSTEDPFVDFQDVFRESTETPDIYFGMNYNDVICEQSKHVLKANNELHQPFLKVDVIPCSRDPQKRMLMFFSLSHCIGDGCTYYNIFKMLTGSEPIQALTSIRVMPPNKQQENDIDFGETSLYKMIGLVVSWARGEINATFRKLCGRGKLSLQRRFFLIDEEKVDLLKDDATANPCSDVPFVSTNDIVTSWFMTHSKVRHGMMVVNLRNRIKGYTMKHAGNYVGLTFYRSQEDTATAQLIRKSLKTNKRAVSYDRPFSLSEMLSVNGFTGVSNWTSFVSKNPFKGCKELLHLPIIPDEGSPLTWSEFCIFRARPGQLAVMFNGTSDVLKNLEGALSESCLVKHDF